VSSGSTVTALLNELEIRPDRVAVEVNLQIVDRQSFDRQMFQEGDRVEIISFIGGGSGVVGGNWDGLCARRMRTSECAPSMRAGEASPNSPLYWWSEGVEGSSKRCNYE
jgi:thiamine biosynthesis protein ThiS